MFFDNYPIKLSDTTKPFLLKGLKTAPAILLIHGYTGSPREMVWLGRQLNEAGYNVYIPRLPGHGTNKDDFLASTWKDWLRAVCEDYINLCSDYGNVYVGGLSMGGLLTALIAARFNPEKIFLCAPAFIAYDNRIKFTPFLKFFIKTVPCGKKNCENDPEYASAIADYNGIEYLAKSADLYRLQKLSLKNLPFIRSQTLTVLSKADKSVPFKVKNIIDKNLRTQNEYLILEKSGHIVVNGIEKEAVAKKIIEFLKD
ncbi:alpha/beta hydrolase [Treponema pedis]|nr:alpha/beta fold hydrolase [Treponema pedis]QOW60847.1 alpha/beta fold hydrolase [Treponema pedis]QSI04106.1 alpha/beta fold hydrolase [Treponema pedis]